MLASGHPGVLEPVRRITHHTGYADHCAGSGRCRSVFSVFREPHDDRPTPVLDCGSCPAGGCVLDPPGERTACHRSSPLHEPRRVSRADHDLVARRAEVLRPGFTLSYAFNHAEAIRAFRQATAIDASCAMCYWGVAFALGPNINAPITEEAAKEAYAAIEQARSAGGQGASERERAYIDALAKRYVADPRAERPPLDAAYAEAMRERWRSGFPDDLDAATLFAQSLMDTSPWNYWNTDGTPRAFTAEVLGALESVLKREVRSRRRDPPLYPRRRSVARSRARRSLRRPAGGARSRRRPPRAHARAHLPAHRPLSTTRRSRTRTPSKADDAVFRRRSRVRAT